MCRACFYRSEMARSPMSPVCHFKGKSMSHFTISFNRITAQAGSTILDFYSVASLVILIM